MSDLALGIVIGALGMFLLLVSAVLIAWAAFEARNERRGHEALERAATPYFERR